MPERLAYLWEWFCHLHERRDAGLTILRINNREVDAWMRVRQQHPTLWDLTVIDKLDGIVIRVATRKSEKGRKGSVQSTNEADAHDRKGLKSVFKNIIARAGVKMSGKKKGG